MAIRYIIGIDEVGRGPIAGPVTLAAVCVSKTNAIAVLTKICKGVKDSKQLTASGRETWLRIIEQLKKEGKLHAAHASVSSARIDDIGLSKAIKTALKNCLNRVVKEAGVKPEECMVLLDGSLKAPEEFIHQETIIKGDEKEPVIALASIVAKVHRDKVLIGFAKKYPGYGFEVHKGYGTARHYASLKRLGICDIHRLSFLKNLR